MIKAVLALALAGVLSAQDIVIPRAPLVLAQAPPPASQSPAAPQPPRVAKKKSSRKTTWIVVGAVAAGVVVGLVVLNKRLDNEGKGIF